MAERGAVTPFDSEIEAAIGAGTAQSVIRGGGIGRSPGSTSVEFEIRRDFPLVTLVSMVAPSPDWFVGVHDLNLIESPSAAPDRGPELTRREGVPNLDDWVSVRDPGLGFGTSTCTSLTRLAARAAGRPLSKED